MKDVAEKFSPIDSCSRCWILPRGCRAADAGTGLSDGFFGLLMRFSCAMPRYASSSWWVVFKVDCVTSSAACLCLVVWANLSLYFIHCLPPDSNSNSEWFHANQHRFDGSIRQGSNHILDWLVVNLHRSVVGRTPTSDGPNQLSFYWMDLLCR